MKSEFNQVHYFATYLYFLNAVILSKWLAMHHFLLTPMTEGINLHLAGNSQKFHHCTIYLFRKMLIKHSPTHYFWYSLCDGMKFIWVPPFWKWVSQNRVWNSHDLKSIWLRFYSLQKWRKSHATLFPKVYLYFILARIGSKRRGILTKQTISGTHMNFVSIIVSWKECVANTLICFINWTLL